MPIIQKKSQDTKQENDQINHFMIIFHNQDCSVIVCHLLNNKTLTRIIKNDWRITQRKRRRLKNEDMSITQKYSQNTKQENDQVNHFMIIFHNQDCSGIVCHLLRNNTSWKRSTITLPM